MPSVKTAATPDPGRPNIGIVGVPPLAVIKDLRSRWAVIHDLDAKLVPDSIDGVSPYLPKVYCAILRTVMLNALHLDLDAIYIDVGPGKCDSALHISTILADILKIPVIRTRNRDDKNFGFPVCQSRLNLLDKFLRITAGVQCVKLTARTADIKSCPPKAGFWGVPPRDFSVLAPFPDHTHIYGWTRCMENKTPANEELERYCNPAVPTIFFAQSFCAKTALAKFLADRHPMALFLDVDYHTSGSAKAKVQAFLELSGAYA
ncbi:MAG: hypothetical protein GXP59_10730 [Deltaproteobacteria bacterium]|nr:hypothetical protein [Deltaproteobacteria bacterium]